MFMLYKNVWWYCFLPLQRSSPGNGNLGNKSNFLRRWWCLLLISSFLKVETFTFFLLIHPSIIWVFKIDFAFYTLVKKHTWKPRYIFFLYVFTLKLYFCKDLNTVQWSGHIGYLVTIHFQSVEIWSFIFPFNNSTRHVSVPMIWLSHTDDNA